jgi:hypothetical protein
MAGVAGVGGGGGSSPAPIAKPQLYPPKTPPQVNVQSTEVVRPTEFAQRAAAVASNYAASGVNIIV